MNCKQCKKYIIHFSSPISIKSARQFVKKLVSKIPDEIEELHLYVNSSGGSVPIALGLAEFLTKLPCKLITYNISHCDSAAILLFAAGDERICLPNGTFFTHAIEVELSGEYTLASLRMLYIKLKKDYKCFLSFISQKTNVTSEKMKNYMTEEGYFLTAQEALECGLVTRIITI